MNKNKTKLLRRPLAIAVGLVLVGGFGGRAHALEFGTATRSYRG